MAASKPRFPAAYSETVVEAMLPRLAGVRGTWLDPFAGMGLSLPRFVGAGHRVIGVEIEQPNVDAGTANGAAGLIEQGDATRLRFRKASISAAFTSCAYGNRFADSHRARDNSLRRSYTHDIRHLTGNPDYELHANNAGKMHFGPEYQEVHRRAWAELWRVLRPGAPFLLNVSDFIRNGQIVHVTTWHLVAVQAQGFIWEDAARIKTRRMRRGQNHEARVDGEWLLCFRRPE